MADEQNMGAAQPAQTPHTPTPDMHMDAKDVEDNKVMALLSYIGVLVLVPLLAKKDSKYAQFHAKQGLVLFLGEVINGILYLIPGVNLVWFFLGWIVSIFFIVLSVMGIINAYQGKAKELPVVGSLAPKIKL
jgi:uncharacterized membrane protein